MAVKEPSVEKSSTNRILVIGGIVLLLVILAVGFGVAKRLATPGYAKSAAPKRDSPVANTPAQPPTPADEANVD